MSKTEVPTILSDSRFLTWIADRLVHIYSESPNVDFVLKLRSIAKNMDKTNPQPDKAVVSRDVLGQIYDGLAAITRKVHELEDLVTEYLNPCIYNDSTKSRSDE